MSMLTIARYRNGYIHISEFNKSIHENGTIFCPFCNPEIKVTGVENKFFRALPKQGGHNCAKKAVEYFDADWDGRKLVETISQENGEIEVTIDINMLGRDAKRFGKNGKPRKPKEGSSPQEIDSYNRYKTYDKVLRDVIRTVTQMKNFINKNSIDDLNKIKFSYKMGTEELNINEVVKLVDELSPHFHKKERFVIYKVESVKIRKGIIYINSYETEGVCVTTSFSYPSSKNKIGIEKGDLVIAYGKLSYYEPRDQYYLNCFNDLNIVKMKNEDLEELFSSKDVVKRQYTKVNEETSNSEISTSSVFSDNSNLSSVFSEDKLESGINLEHLSREVQELKSSSVKNAETQQTIESEYKSLEPINEIDTDSIVDERVNSSIEITDSPKGIVNRIIGTISKLFSNAK